MGIVVDIIEWKKKKKEKEEAKKRISFSPFKMAKSTAQKIKEALEKYGSHKKNKNNDPKKGN